MLSPPSLKVKKSYHFHCNFSIFSLAYKKLKLVKTFLEPLVILRGILFFSVAFWRVNVIRMSKCVYSFARRLHIPSWFVMNDASLMQIQYNMFYVYHDYVQYYVCNGLPVEPLH